MFTPNLKRTVPVVVVSLLVFTVACGETVTTGPLREESQTLELGGAEAVKVEIEMSVGTLRIGGGADDLLEAEFTYNVAEWKPVVEYRVRGEHGRLRIEQPDIDGLSLGNKVRYQWDLRFGENIPLELAIEFGAGRSYLDLAGLDIEELTVAVGAGEVELDLTDNPRLDGFSLKTGAGDVTVDLRGDWTSELRAEIAGGVGRVRLLLPEHVGVRVDAEKGIGKIQTRGMREQRGAFVNDAYGESDVTLYIECETGIGAIILDVGGVVDEEGTTI